MKYLSEEKVSKIVTKLIKDTRNGELEWREDLDNLELGAEERLIGKAYTANLNNRHLRIYKYKYKLYLDIDKFGWSESYRLEFVDIHGNSEWEFPNTNSIKDLYESVTYQASGVDDFFDAYLNG